MGINTATQEQKFSKLPSPRNDYFFQINQQEWIDLEQISSTKVRPRDRMFIVHTCNSYILQICRHKSITYNYNVGSKIRSIIDSSNKLVSFLEKSLSYTSGSREYGNQDSTECGIKGLDNKDLEKYLSFNGCETRHLVLGDDDHVPSNDLNREARTMAGILFSNVIAHNAAEEILIGIERLRSIEKEQLPTRIAPQPDGAILTEHTEGYIHAFNGNPGDVFAHLLTYRIWIAYKNSGGSGKYGNKSVSFISYIFKKMIEKVFSFMDTRIYASIYPGDDTCVANRLKRATAFVNKNICEIDTSCYFDFNIAKSISTGSLNDIAFLMWLTMEERADYLHDPVAVVESGNN